MNPLWNKQPLPRSTLKVKGELTQCCGKGEVISGRGISPLPIPMFIPGNDLICDELTIRLTIKIKQTFLDFLIKSLKKGIKLYEKNR